MKKLRIILSVIIVLAVVSAMFACGGKKDDKPESGGSPSESGSSISPGESDSSEPPEDEVIFSLNREIVEIYIRPEDSESGFISEFRAEVTELSINGAEVTDPGLEWSSGDESVATVENGLIKPVKAGETNISVTYRPEGKEPVSAEVYVFVYVEVSYRVKIFKRPWTEEGNADEVLENTEVYYDRLDSDTLEGKEIKIEDYVPEKGYGIDNEASVLSGTLTPGGETVLEIHLVQREPVPEPVAAGIREMSLNDIELLSPDSGTATLKPDKGFLVYKAAQSGGGDGRKFRIAGNGNLAPESHVAFLVKFKTKNENGLSLKSCKHGTWSEFEFYNDKHELVDYDLRDTDIWYVAVSPDAGYNESSEDYHNVFFFCDWAKPEVLIAGIYEVSPEAYIDAFPKEPRLAAPEEFALENGTSENMGARIEFEKEDSPAIVYEVMDGSSVVTVDANGMVTAKEVGSCDIKISAEGIGEIICHVTVKVALPRLDGEGIAEVSVDRLLPMAFKAGTKFEKTPEGYMRYSGTSGSEAENKFSLNGNGGLDSDSYLVFLIMYTENQVLGDCGSPDGEGIWLGMFPYGTDGWAYFSIFDTEGYDYTIYKDQFDKDDVMLSEGVDTHHGYGSLNRPDEGYTTKSDTWYFFVSPYKNLNGTTAPYANSYFTDIGPFDYIIARMYTVNEEAYQRLFKPNVRPKQGPALEIDARKLSLKAGESVNLNAILKNTEGEITYEAENDCVTVDGDGRITAVKEGDCKVVIKGAGLQRECAVKVLPGEKPEEEGDHAAPREGAMLRVYALDKGYHADWVRLMLEAFAEQDWVQYYYPNINVENFYSNEIWDYGEGQIEAEEEGQFDLLFGVFGSSEYAEYLEDLTASVYNKPVPGEKTLYKDKIFKSIMDAMAYIDPDGKDTDVDTFYCTPWAGGMQGLLYNENLITDLNIELPRTTDELKEICEKIKGLKGENEDYPEKFTFIDVEDNSYLKYLFPVWWAQYEGVENYNNFYKGLVDGEPSNKIFEQQGRLYALQLLEDLFAYDPSGDGYLDYRNMERAQAQGQYIQGHGLFMPNGDWFPTEVGEAMEELGDTAPVIKMMRTPMISKLGEKLGITEEELRNTISYVDDPANNNKPVYAAVAEGYTQDSVIERVREARRIVHSIGDGHTAVVPCCAPNKDVAIDFLRFMATDLAQDIYMEYTKGASLPFKYDVGKSNPKLYQQLDPLHQNRLDYFNSMDVEMLIEDRVFPLFAIGKVDAFIAQSYWGVFSNADYLNKKPASGTLAQKMYDDTLEYWTEERFMEAYNKTWGIEE